MLTSVALGQSGSTVSASGDIVASKFIIPAAWRQRSFALLPRQVTHNSERDKRPRPRLQGSYTGYIENAIVGNQIRFRFDAGFDIQNPDRAEFFYAKCGCYRSAKPPAYDPNAPGPGPGIALKLNSQELHLNLEYAPFQRLSFFADVPERSIEFTSVTGGALNNASGFGDFQAGLKFAFVATPQTYVTFQMGAFMPTGNALRGLGTNHYSIEPMLLFNQRLSDHVTLAGQFGDWHPIGGSAGVASPNGFAGDILIYGIGAGYDFATVSESHITPVLEFVGWSVRGGFATTAANPVLASGTNIVNGKLGFRYSFHSHNSIYAGFGEAFTNAHWYKEILRLEYRYAF
jgi:hypothetical protein